MDIRVAMSNGRQVGYTADSVFIRKEYYRYVIEGTSLCTDFIFGDISTDGGFATESDVYVPVFPKGYKRLDSSRLRKFLFIPDMTQTYLIVNRDFKELGTMTVTRDLYKNSSIDISMLVIFDKGRGTGTEVVKYLRQMGFTLHGFAIANAYSFWEKQGAEFLPNGRFILRRTDC